MAGRMQFVLLMLACNLITRAGATDTTYQKRWMEIDTLIAKKDFTKTAIEKTSALLSKAKEEHKAIQETRCLLYLFSLESRVSAENSNPVFRDIKKAIAESRNEAQKALLHTLTARLYRNYFQQHRYQLYGRQNTGATQESDIDTWSTQDFYTRIRREYEEALQNRSLLQQRKVDEFEALLIPGNARELRPTLFDLLAHEALSYFTKEEIWMARPGQVFNTADTALIATAQVFTAAVFGTRDSSASQWAGIQLYRELIRFHRQDSNREILLMADLERLQWAYSICTTFNKEAIYRRTLELMRTDFADIPATAQVWYLLAKLEADHAQKYQPYSDSTGRLQYILAKQIAEKGLDTYRDNNTGTANLKNLIQQVSAKELRGQVEMVNLPGKPFRALVSYRNTDTVYLRIIPIDNAQHRATAQWNPEYWKTMLAIRPIRTGRQWLPGSGDHQPHNAELKIDALPVGDYALLLSTDPGFTEKEAQLSIQYFSVTQISFIKSGNDYFVLNRESGKPMPNVRVQIIKQIYISRSQKTIGDTIATRITDKNGFFRFVPNTYSSYQYLFTSINDHYNAVNTSYNAMPDESLTNQAVSGETSAASYENANRRVFFFTDRPIYRPGQWVYFKGIAVTKNAATKLSRIITDKEPGTVYLLDVNGKKIDSLRTTLNEFGSFSGRFRLPQQLLTGLFTINYPKYNFSGISLSVEEYKRPRFIAKFDPVKNSYRLNDSITVTGSVAAMAGNPLENAKVSYHIVRTPRFIGIRNRISTYTQPANREIAFGEILTDTAGRFSIRFRASAEDIETLTENFLQDFSLSADVTDAGGETRSISTSITAGKQALRIDLTQTAVTETDSLTKILVYTRNLSNQPEQAIVQLKIYPLVSPQRLIRARYWHRPDQFIYTEKQYLEFFPNDEYNNETDQSGWSRGTLVAEGEINTGNTNSFNLPAQSLAAGHYLAEAITHDRYGNEIRQQAYFRLFDRSKKQLPSTSYQFTYNPFILLEPGSRATLFSGSSANDLYVISRTGRDLPGNTGYSISNRKAGLQEFGFDIRESDRSGFRVQEVYVINNRFYQNQWQVMVASGHKPLKITYETYRNHIEPGSEEKWSISVKGPNGEKVAAELLTGMYDASLDQLRSQNWTLPYLGDNSITNIPSFEGYAEFRTGLTVTHPLSYPYIQIPVEPHFDRLAKNGWELVNGDISRWLKDTSLHLSLPPAAQMPNEMAVAGETVLTKQTLLGSVQATTDYDRVYTRNEGPAAFAARGTGMNNNAGPAFVQARKDFNETAFFFPQLQADSTGNFSFSFTMPEALTQWKWMSIAHTPELAFGMQSMQLTTEKKLMVQPNPPRFLREGDHIELSTRIANNSKEELTGQVILELTDAADGRSVDGWFQNIFPSQYFTIAAGQSSIVRFPVQVPYNFNKPINWRIKAVAGNFSDGEENTLPVLSNRTLVTETLPLLLQKDSTQHFVFDKLLKNQSESLTTEALTVEYSTHPAWYAVQALPYLMEYPYECAEQSFNRLYANQLAAWLLNRNSRIKKIVDRWRTDSSTLKSNLNKNPELKQLLLQETPWVIQAVSEEEQKKNIAILFDLARIGTASGQLLEKLQQLQLPNGAFPWFRGGYADRYITNYILTGIGKLKRLGALSPELAAGIRPMLLKAVQYLDAEMEADYQSLKKNSASFKQLPLAADKTDYLYMRSFFRDMPQPYEEAYRHFYTQGKKYWTGLTDYYKAVMGLVCYRNKDEETAMQLIAPALIEHTIKDNRQGMYWKNSQAHSWYQSPIEYQAMMIAFFSEINQGRKEASTLKNIDAMKTWLVLNKQASNWKTTLATADACYALLQDGSDWLSTEKNVTIQLGKTLFSNSTLATEAGTGYFKKRIEGRMVSNDMGSIRVTVQSPQTPFGKTAAANAPSYGAVYWQYFEDMDKISASASPLSVVKKIFVEKNTDKGPVLIAVAEGDELKAGDKIVVRMELRSDRDMDYLHLKDLRAASMEPVNVLSGYRWQDGLGYYESTRDASSSFFIDHLRKGTYIFTYPMHLTHAGIFSAGIASIESMYAPEFNSHSASMHIRVVQ